MLDFLKHLFSGEPFMPHIHCFLDNPGLTWLHVLSDASIGISYVAISLTLALLVYRGRREIPFHSMFIAFGVFIIACGCTHFMEILTLWVPTYWLSGGVKAITAAASVLTAVALPPLVPVALKMVHDANVSERRQRELQSKNEELAGLYEKLKQFDDLKTHLFANVSHELRTPLTLILAPTERMLGDPEAAAFRGELEGIRRNARTLLKHVNDLLDVAKMESGEMAVDYQRVDLARLLRRAAADFESVASERGIAFHREMPDRLTAQVDADKIRRVLVNLLANAIRFTPEGGTVRCRMSLTADGRRALLEVADTGPGVPPEMREAVFERFRQVKSHTSDAAPGTGLGLAIVKEFVELHGGRTWVDQAAGGGARFVVEIPLHAPPGAAVRDEEAELPESSTRVVEAEQLAAVVPEPPTAAVPMGDGDRPLVLVVEDNLELNEFITRSLAPHYRTASAVDGQEGLEKALALRPDLVLSDVMMPRLSGDSMARALRDAPETAAIPVVLLTAKADEELRVRMLREGVQDYMMKPFSAEELHARIANLVVIKRTRELLQAELSARRDDLEHLVREVTAQRRDLKVAVESMRVARDQAEQASRVKTNFLRLVSHELRTPLTALTLQLQLLQRHRKGALTDREGESLRKMTVASTRLQDLIESLLEHARIEAGRLTIHPAELDLRAIASEAVEEARPQAEQQGLEVLLTVPDELPPLYSDRRLVRLILTNLLDNALKFTERGEIEVSLAYTPQGHRLAVRDTGIGIAPEQQAQIFEPFEHLEPLPRKHTPGVGLGLALVREMVDALGGGVELHSAVGQGSTFEVTLPNRPR